MLVDILQAILLFLIATYVLLSIVKFFIGKHKKGVRHDFSSVAESDGLHGFSGDGEGVDNTTN